MSIYSMWVFPSLVHAECIECSRVSSVTIFKASLTTTMVCNIFFQEDHEDGWYLAAEMGKFSVFFKLTVLFSPACAILSLI